MEFSWNSNTKCTEVPQSSISLQPFSEVLCFFFLNIWQTVVNTMVTSVVYLLCPRAYILSYFIKLLRDLSLSGMVVACMFHQVREKFSEFMVFTFLENALNLHIFTHALIPHSKFQDNINIKEWRKLCFNLSKFNQKTWRWLGTRLFIFFIICNFSKCDGFTYNTYHNT